MENTNWIGFIDHTNKKKPAIPRVWREAQCNDEHTFNRYGFGIFATRENGRWAYQCCICYRNWNKGGFAKGNKFHRIEDAYDDFPALMSICAKGLGFRFPVADAIYTNRFTDKQAMIRAAAKNGMF